MNRSIATTNYITQATNAGYDDSDEGVILVSEFDTYFLLLTYDANEGEHLVGTFYKANDISCGDYSGAPLFIGNRADALDYFASH